MTIRSILLHLTEDPRASARIEAALGLARRHDAHVTALYVTPVFRWPSSMDGRIPEQFKAQIEADEKKRAAEMRDGFEQACKRESVIGEWREARGDAVSIVSEHARYADIVVVGQADPENATGGADDLAQELVFTAGRPILVIPYVGKYPTLGERVVVAWKSSRESARAVTDALPILEKAKSVTVLSVNASEKGHYPGQDIAAFLARHKVKAEARKTVGADIDVSDVLLSTASDIGADLMVMGAYSRSRLREAVLGGVTNDILDRMTVPTLLAH